MNTADGLTHAQRRAISGPVAELLDRMQEDGGPLVGGDALCYAARSMLAMAGGMVFAQLGIESDEAEMGLLNEWAHRAMDQIELLALARGHVMAVTDEDDDTESVS